MSGSGKKAIGSIVVCLLFAFQAYCQTNDIFTFHFDNHQTDEKISSDGYDIHIPYSIHQLSFVQTGTDQGIFNRLSIPNHTTTTAYGKPELPIYSSLVVIPEDNVYSVKITDIKYEEIFLDKYDIAYPIYPAQEEPSKNSERAIGIIEIDKKAYSSNSYLEHDTVAISVIGKVRGETLATLTISPIFYNPSKNSLLVITNMNVDVCFSGAKSLSVSNSAIGEIVKRAAINYNAEEVVPEYTNTPMRMVILTDSTFDKALQPFIRWKHQKGIETKVIFIGDTTVGTTYSELRNALSDIYYSWNKPDYLLIVGNTDIIPYYEASTSITDLYYGEYDGGTDYMPDILIGRIPAADTSDVSNITSKIIQYEKMDFPDNGSYLRNALVFAGYDADYEDIMNRQIDYAINNYLTTPNNIDAYYSYAGYSVKDSIIDILNDGVSFVNYTGHGNPTTWLNVTISSRDTSLLTNTDKYPVVISNACQTSKFNSPSLGNALVETKGKGAVAFIGSSHDTYWSEDYYWSIGIGTLSSAPTYYNTGLGAYDRLFHTHNESPSEWYRSLGQIVYAGNLSVSVSASNRKKRYWEMYNIVGDPSLIPNIGTPKEINLSIPDTLPNNLPTLSLKGEPFAYIAISHNDTLLTASHFNHVGQVTLSLPNISNDSCTVVVTGQNLRPLIKNVYFRDMSEEYVALLSHSYTVASGDDDQLFEHGETISVGIDVYNYGNKAATNLQAHLQSSSRWVTVIDSIYNIGTLAGKDTISIANCFSFRIADSIPDNCIVPFDIILRDDADEIHSSIEITTHAPVLSISSNQIDDSVLGNNNNVIDPEESFQIIYTIVNTGSEPADIDLTVTADNPYIDIQGIDSFTIADSTSRSITLNVSQTAQLPVGTMISITCVARDSLYAASSTITIQIGGAIESFESGDFSAFPWINDKDNPWTIISSTSSDGIMSAKSGKISNSESSVLTINCIYEKSDTISFDYKASSELLYDIFSFSINGRTIVQSSGNTEWTNAKCEVPSGYNTLKWTYIKDGTMSYYDDCAYIDIINFAQSQGIRFIYDDISVDNITSPLSGDEQGAQTVSANITNHGIDTIKTFDLAYRINNGRTIIERFDTAIISGQTVNVSFDTQASIGQPGDYLVEVFLYNNIDEYIQNDTTRSLINKRGTDISILEILSPKQSTPHNDEEEVTVKIACQMETDITSIPLAFQLNNGEIIQQTFRQRLYAPMDTAVFTFSDKIDLSTYGKYTITVFNKYANDCNHINDTLTVTITNRSMSSTIHSYPNPFTSDITINIKADNDGKATFTLFDMSGRKVEIFETDIFEGMNQIRHSFTHISTGVYILRIDFNGRTHSTKIIKQ